MKQKHIVATIIAFTLTITSLITASYTNLTNSIFPVKEEHKVFLEPYIPPTSTPVIPSLSQTRANLMKIKGMYPQGLFYYSLAPENTFDNYLNQCLVDFSKKYAVVGKYKNLSELYLIVQEAADGKRVPTTALARFNLMKIKSLYPQGFIHYNLGYEGYYDTYLNVCLVDFADKFAVKGKYSNIEQLYKMVQEAANKSRIPTTAIARYNLMKIKSMYPNLGLNYSLGYSGYYDSYFNSSLYNFVVKFGLVGKYTSTEELYKYVQEAANGTRKPPVSTATIKRQAIVSEARSWLGVPYLWGGNTKNGIDCSGLAQQVYKRALGISLPRTTTSQLNVGTRVSRSNLLPGDLVFPHTGHVMIYIDDGKVIHAPGTGRTVRIADIYNFYTARRIIN